MKSCYESSISGPTFHAFVAVTVYFPPPGSPYQPVIEALGNYPEKKFYNVSKLGGAKYGNDTFLVVCNWDGTSSKRAPHFAAVKEHFTPLKC